MNQMGDGVAILPTAPERPRNRDVNYPFRPDSDFYYLTGFPEPQAVMVLAPGRPEGEFILYCRPKDPQSERWEGKRQGIEGARQHYGADQAFPIEELEATLPTYLEDRFKVYTMIGRYSDFDNKITQTVGRIRQQQRSGVDAPGEIADLSHLLHEMRLIKRKEELKLMRQAAQISARGHIRAMQNTMPDRFEYQVQAMLECEFRLGGSGWTAYPSIVAGGANACILHYTENNCKLRDGDLLLIDAGAELDCYAADITRTFPVNGRFSAEQRAVYEVVLSAQEAAIAAVTPDRTLVEYHDVAVRVLTEGLVDLDLLQGDPDELVETKAYRRFYMHNTGHWLGMDVHDVGGYKVEGMWRLLEPGMVLTVEPGLYISAEEDIPERWHHIGIRIEDDILVTRSSNENLTTKAPKTIDDIEHLMAS